jgi:hypothetical protein
MTKRRATKPQTMTSKITFIKLDITIVPELSTFCVDLEESDGARHYLGRLTCETETMHELQALLELGARRAGGDIKTEIVQWKV